MFIVDILIQKTGQLVNQKVKFYFILFFLNFSFSYFESDFFAGLIIRS